MRRRRCGLSGTALVAPRGPRAPGGARTATGPAVAWPPMRCRPLRRTAFAAATLALSAAPAQAAALRLPDLDQETPRQLDVMVTGSAGHPHFRLGFGSAVRNVRAITHQHWHLHGFDRYELRRAGAAPVLVRDRKSGFCLGDRYRVVGRTVPAAAPQPVYTSNCA